MKIRVSLVFSAGPRLVEELPLELEQGATVAQALQASGWSDRVGMGDDGLPLLGVWGRKALPGQVLRDHDRVEIHRPLTVDPKVARRARFVRQGARTAGLFARKRPGAKAGY